MTYLQTDSPALLDALAALANLMAEYAPGTSDCHAELYDIAPLLTALSQRTAYVGNGRASGEGRANNAARLALAESHLAKRPLSEFGSAVVIITATEEITMSEYLESCDLIAKVASSAENDGPDIQSFLTLDNSFGKELRVIVMAADTPSRMAAHP